MKYHFIHERGDFAFLAVEEAFNGWTSSIKKVSGYGETPVFVIYKNGWARILSLSKQHKKIVKFVWRKVNQDKKFVSDTKNEFIKRAGVFLEFINSLPQFDLCKLSTDNLIKIKQRYVKLYHQLIPYGEPIPYFLKEKIRQVLDKYLLVDKKISVKDYEALISSIYPSYLERANKELFFLSRIKNKSALDKALKKYTNKYAWIYFDYAGQPVTKKDFARQLVSLKKNQMAWFSEKKNGANKLKLIKKYKINPYIKYLISVLDESYWLMDAKKEVFTQAHFNITSLYKEAGRRIGLSFSQVRWLVWREVESALRIGTKTSLKLVSQRKKSCVIKLANGHFNFLKAKQSRQVVDSIKKDEQINKKISIVRGVASSPGKAIGKIRYLKSARECGKIKAGEILLVSNTTPDFMPAIRLVKAIVTNEGGITCHAAIISREMKIPCVVGTKIATQVFKTGDRVEVDANRGVVRKI